MKLPQNPRGIPTNAVFSHHRSQVGWFATQLPTPAARIKADAGCHAVRYSEPVPPTPHPSHGFGVPNRVAPGANGFRNSVEPQPRPPARGPPGPRSQLFVIAIHSTSMSNGPVHSGTQKKIRAGGLVGKKRL